MNGRLVYRTNGYVPLGFNQIGNGIMDFKTPIPIPKMPIPESIGQILNSIEREKQGEAIFATLPESEMTANLRRRFDPRIASQLSFLVQFDMANIKSIPESVKDKVLDWACALERAGVHGDGMSFDDREKTAAHTIVFNISNSSIEQLNNLGTNVKKG